jgi:SAM-dependent methyltransferase
MTNIAELNRKTFERYLSLRAYRKSHKLQPAEAFIFGQFRGELSGRRILDIGVGAGRTVPYLLDLSADYIGIDYSPRMVAECRKKFPEVQFEVCDARDMSRFSNGSFGFVFFSFNGIDYVEHEDRLRTLAEVRRVLSPEGLYAFSTHNRAYQLRGPWSLLHSPLAVNPIAAPLGFARRVVTYHLGILNYYRNKRLERYEDEYALTNDGAHEFGLLTYYTHVDHQVLQLQHAGFSDIRVVGLDGHWRDPTRREPCAGDAWLYYVCRREKKPASGAVAGLNG